MLKEASENKSFQLFKEIDLLFFDVANAIRLKAVIRILVETTIVSVTDPRCKYGQRLVVRLVRTTVQEELRYLIVVNIGVADDHAQSQWSFCLRLRILLYTFHTR